MNPYPLTHFDSGGQAQMVDVAAKPATRRVAIAQGRLLMQPATLALVAQGSPKKGDVLGVARLAGIMGAKRTADLIPLCHTVALTRVAIEFELLESESALLCRASAETVAPTGVEMEALTAVSCALLTVYDMLKAIDRGMVISDLGLLEKHGGASGSWTAAA